MLQLCFSPNVFNTLDVNSFVCSAVGIVMSLPHVGNRLFLHPLLKGTSGLGI